MLAVSPFIHGAVSLDEKAAVLEVPLPEQKDASG